MKSSIHIEGLTTKEVVASQQQHGLNKIDMDEDKVLLHVLKEVVLEPMFILLIAGCIIYFSVGQYREGFIMAISVFIVSGISIFQEYRSRNAIRALKKLSASGATVMRDGRMQKIATEQIVPGDVLLLEEGEIIGADGIILSANDLSLNESVLTGESFPVNKTAEDKGEVYKGTLVTSGSAVIRVNAVGAKTMFGKIGSSLKVISILKTPLQQQVRSFVRKMVWFGALAFLFVVAYNYYHSGNLIKALLQGLTLAMSVLPEEIPVAFSTFQALGAFRLMRNHIIVKQPQYVETLGSATIICVDKTGTLTQNKMSIAYLYDAVNDVSIQLNNNVQLPADLIEYAMWSSETNPFDPMEKAIHALYEKNAVTDKRSQFEQVHEYPIGGRPPMMTHIFRDKDGETIIAAKGSPEAILQQSNLPTDRLTRIKEQVISYAKEGYRVLGVGKGSWKEKNYPVAQQEFSLEFLGLIAFQDPPKENIAETIAAFHQAGIRVAMITGDYAETAVAISRQIKLDQHYDVLTGEDIQHLDKEALKQQIKQVNIFARMYPEAKLKVIDAFKENGEIVAMTGDGVNDAPALKAAHIGIAMGQRGSEVAKAAASLILADDDLAHMVDAVANGRKIYDNLKKAIQYIVSIHIPIILIVILPLLLAWKFTDIFSPVHVIFLELIMGPTCSIIYENEPMEPGTMMRPPRKMESSFLSSSQLLISIIQGLLITAGCLGIGYCYSAQQHADETIRSVIFITLLFSNIFLTLINRSFHDTVFKTLRYKNNLILLVTGVSLFCIALFLYFPFARQLFRLAALPLRDVLCCLLVAFASTAWIELWKAVRKK